MDELTAAVAPSIEDFERLAREAFEALPAAVRRACAELLVRVADFAPDEVLDEMEIEDPYELTGLYEGIALTERSVMHQPTRAGRGLALPPADPGGVDRPRRRRARPAGEPCPGARDRPPSRLV